MATRFEPLLSAFNDAGVDYVLVGGLAVVAHGRVRATMDMDFVLRLEKPNILRAMAALESLGYVPRAPVVATQFADDDLRQRWIRDKGMVVFSMMHADATKPTVDLFPEYPLDFERLWRNSEIMRVGASVARICGLDDLIELKRRAGRPRDIDDIRALEVIRDASK
ncbi:MAG TPA: DUF6036 family nucleotidyltransferase [Kofleriaceae bacterium]|nr:DUF6036 family nucleotidyltransferase [Kofleriaceae bacterium]